MTQLPLLGQAVRHEWALDPDFLSVNRGSFGAAPRVVLAAQREWQQRLEAQPSRFMRAVLPDALRHAADRLLAVSFGLLCMDKNRARHCSSKSSASKVKLVVTQPRGRPKASSPVHRSSSRARVCSAADERGPFTGKLPDR